MGSAGTNCTKAFEDDITSNHIELELMEAQMRQATTASSKEEEEEEEIIGSPWRFYGTGIVLCLGTPHSSTTFFF